MTFINETKSIIDLSSLAGIYFGPICSWYSIDAGRYVFEKEVDIVKNHVNLLYAINVTAIYANTKTWAEYTDMFVLQQQGSIGETLGLAAYIDNSISDFVFTLN